MVNVRESADLVALRIVAGLGIDRFSKQNFESIGRDVDTLDLERHFAGPIQPLQREGFNAAYRPAAIGAAGQQTALPGELHIQDSGGKPFAKRVTRALPHAVDLLGGRAHKDRLRVVAEKYLIFKRPKLAACLIDHIPGDRAPHADVGKHHRIRHEFLHLFLFGDNACAALWRDRPRKIRGVRVPVKTRRVPHEPTGLEKFQAARGIPRSLTLYVKQRAVFVRADAARTT